MLLQQYMLQSRFMPIQHNGIHAATIRIMAIAKRWGYKIAQAYNSYIVC
jgi:hypothetical protein